VGKTDLVVVAVQGAPPFSFLTVSRVLPLPRARQQNALQVATQDENDLRVPIMVLPALTASLRHIPFLFYLSFRALKQRLPTPSRYRAAAVRSFSYLVLVLPLCTYIYSIQSP
jgi:hypothetical protein